ncbi:hypothetical protein ACFL6D_02875 [Spirochaetota bacterium]
MQTYINFKKICYILLILLLIFQLIFPVKKDTDIISMMEFYNADIKDVINYIADVTGYSIIIDPTISGRISVSAKDKITVRESLDLIETLLQAIGYTFEKQRNIITIVKLKDISMIKDIYSDLKELEKLENKNRIVTFIRQVKYAKGEVLIRNIDRFKSKFGNMIYDNNSQKLIITDFIESIIHINKLIDQLDVSDQAIERVIEIIELENLSVDQVIEIIRSSITDVEVEDTRYPATRRIVPRYRPDQKAPPKIQVISLDRNDRFILAGQKEKVAEIKKLISELDKKFKTDTKINYEIIKLEVFSSDEMLDILNKLLFGMDPSHARSTRTTVKSSAIPYVKLKGKVDFLTISNKGYLVLIGEDQDRKIVKNIINNIEQNLTKDQVFALAKVIRIVPIQYFKSKDIIAILNQLKIQSKNKSSTIENIIDDQVLLIDNQQDNSIIINAPSKRIDYIGEFIKLLDKRIPQVLIEVMIVEVSYKDDTTIGIDYDNINLDNLFRKNAVTATAVFGGGAKRPGFTVWKNTDPTAIVSLLSEYNAVNIVSTPNLLTLDNQSAEITIQDKKAVTKEEIKYGDPSSGSKDYKVTSFDYQTAGLKLSITPQINDEKNVTLDITHTIDDFKESSVAGYSDISTRAIKTKITITDKSTALLGGLIKNKKVQNDQGIPGLMHIPIIGILFKKSVTKIEKTELLIFITPYIINDEQDLNELSERKLLDTLSKSKYLSKELGKETEKDKK